MPVATWYRSGWNRWWLRRSTSVTSTGSRPSSRAAGSPPNPPPTMTTRCRLGAGATAVKDSSQPRTGVHEAAVDEDGGGRHVSGAFTREEGHHLADLRRVRHAA